MDSMHAHVRRRLAQPYTQRHHATRSRRCCLPAPCGATGVRHGGMPRGLRSGGVEPVAALQRYVRRRDAAAHAPGADSGERRRGCMPVRDGRSSVQCWGVCGRLRCGPVGLVAGLQRYLRWRVTAAHARRQPQCGVRRDILSPGVADAGVLDSGVPRGLRHVRLELVGCLHGDLWRRHTAAHAQRYDGGRTWRHCVWHKPRVAGV